jgi:hypothetical protein
MSLPRPRSASGQERPYQIRRATSAQPSIAAELQEARKCVSHSVARGSVAPAAPRLSGPGRGELVMANWVASIGH